MQTVLIALSPAVCIVGLFLYSRWLWKKATAAAAAETENKYLIADREMSNVVDKIIADSSNLNKQQLLERLQNPTGENKT